MAAGVDDAAAEEENSEDEDTQWTSGVGEAGRVARTHARTEKKVADEREVRETKKHFRMPATVMRTLPGG